MLQASKGVSNCDSTSFCETVEVHLGLGYLVKLRQIAGRFTAVAATVRELHPYVLIATTKN